VRSSQLLLVGLGIALTLSLFFFGNTKTPPKVLSQDSSVKSSAEKVSLKDSIVLLRQGLNTAGLAKLDSLEQGEKPESLLEMANFWEKRQSLPSSSYYFTEYAKLQNDEDSWRQASQRCYLAYQMAQDTLWKPYFAAQSIDALEKTLSFAPSDIRSKIHLADCLIEGQNQVMPGVLLLREVVEQEPKNIPANLMLGRLSIVSGQFDKAKQRLQTVLEEAPENTEALYFLGETLVALGEKEEAIRVFEKCKRLVNNPRFERELDKYLNDIINKQ